MDRQQSMVAVGLEAGPGLLGVFGIGHMYAGRVGTGLLIMVSYWILQAINIFLLVPLFIGYVTVPLTMMAYLVAAPTNVLSSRPRS